MELEGEESPWPAFTDLLAATSLLFLTLFAVIAVPAIEAAREGNERRSTLEALFNRLRSAAGPGVEIERLADHLIVTIQGELTFGQSEFALRDLKPQGRAILASFSSALVSVMDSIHEIQVVGHASQEGTEAYNYELTAKRAVSVALFLTEVLGIQACRVSALGRNRNYPLNPEAAREGAQPDPLDRRIELEIRPVIPGDQAQQDRRARCVERRR